jgi:hypothetical protein
MMLILTKIDQRAYREDEGDAPRLVKVAIQSDRIRCFNPRREGAGTRLTFADGGGFAVQEDGAAILTMLGETAGAREYATAPVAPITPVATATEGEALN